MEPMESIELCSMISHLPPLAERKKRAGASQIEALARLICQNEVVQEILVGLSGAVLVLNEFRQVVAWSKGGVADKLADLWPADPTSLRIGEALGCVRSGAEGCGLSPGCSHCGSLLSVLAAQSGRDFASGSCSMSLEPDRAWAGIDLHVTARPLKLGDVELVVVVLRDITDERRRQELERIFFHDIRNTLVGLQGWTEMLVEEAEGELYEAARKSSTLVRRLSDEVEAQDLLVKAEGAQLELNVEPWAIDEVAREVAALFEHQALAKNKVIELGGKPPSEAIVETDRRVLFRILVNMVKNALEAAGDGDTIRVGWEKKGSVWKLTVWNPQSIPEENRPRIFERSFSTKGSFGRGLGTYSMKLLAERNLGAKVGFVSSDEEGTTFYLDMPTARS